MQAENIHVMMRGVVLLLFLGASFGCATNRQVHTLKKEMDQLRNIVLKMSKEAKESGKLSARIAGQVEAAAARAEKAASRAESAAMKAERSVEIFLYEEKVKTP